MKKEVLDYVICLLETLKKGIPSSFNHNIQLNDTGDLCLFIGFSTEGKWQEIVFDVPEEKSSKELAYEIIQDLKNAGYKF